MRHWSRGQKTARNLILAMLLTFLLCASQGFPPCTVRGMCRRFQHDYLLEELEPLYVQRDWIGFSDHNRHYTMVAARSGGIYTIFRYRDSLLGSHQDWSGLRPVLGEGAVCTARAGVVYAAGPFEGAAAAVAVVRAEKAPEPNGTVRTREFLLEGTRLADQVFAFPYERGHSRIYWEDTDEDPMDYLEMTLPDIAELWYRRPLQNASGAYSLPDTELPCTVTLYDEAGEALEVFELTVWTADLRSWY